MICDVHLAKKIKAVNVDQYEIYLSQIESTSIEVKEQQVEGFTSAQKKGVSLRIVKGDRLGFSYCTEFNETSFDHVISNAMMSAQNSSPDYFHGFPGIIQPLPKLGLCDNSIFSIPKEKKIEKVKKLEHTALTCDKRITKVRKALYQERIATEYLINSNGINLSHQDTFFSCAIMVIAEGKGDSQMGWDYDFSRFYHDLDVAKIGKLAASRALSLLGAQSVSSFRGPVILDNSVSCQLLGVLIPSFLAESVQKNKSLLKGKMNQKIFSPTVDIIDDGLYPGGAATQPFDGEGVISQSTLLIERGVLRNFLYDTYCARKDKTHSTGNSSRNSIKVPPNVGHSNLYIDRGKERFDDLTSQVDTGLFVNEIMGIHTANPISGDFSVGANGFLIKNGKKTVPVKGIAISGNIMTIFNRVSGVGSDLRFFGSIGSPSLLIEGMDISGT